MHGLDMDVFWLNFEAEGQISDSVLMANEHFSVSRQLFTSETHCITHFLWFTLEKSSAASGKDRVSGEDCTVDLLWNLVSIDLFNCVLKPFLFSSSWRNVIASVASCVAWGVIACYSEIIYLDNLLVHNSISGAWYVISLATDDLELWKQFSHILISTWMILMLVGCQNHCRRTLNSLGLQERLGFVWFPNVD